MTKYINAEIERRTRAGQELAVRFPELRGRSFTELAAYMEDMGLNLPFITLSEMHGALNGALGA